MDFTQVAEVFDSFVGVASPGAAIEIRTRGKVLFRRAGGLTGIAEAGRNQFGEPVFDGPDLDRGTLVGEHTSFDLASLTKPLSTALLVAMACDDGDLSLDETLGSFDFLGVPAARAGVSIRDLLLHRSGLVDWLPFAQKLVPSHGMEVCGSETARAECVLMAMNSAPGGRAGRDVVYSDVGYVLLGIILEQLFGCTLPELFDERVAGPLGLSVTRFMPAVPVRGSVDQGCRDIAATAYCPLRDRVMCGEVHDDNAWLLGGAAGHAGLFSNVVETATMVDVWIEAIEGRSELLSSKTARAFSFEDFGEPGVRRTPAFDRPAPSGSNAGDLCPAGTVGHLGFTGTSFWFDRDSGVSIVLLTNRTNPFMTGMQAEIKMMRRAVYDASWKALS
ncbi:MAG TPA: serine hydrolase [Myxococcota bacterium]|nr:serine hydrolase [Myxococcota bacterium]HQP96756.1 serine hydrolase [Myxococcota bacterium]